jgi:hypothetical protein
MKAFCTAALTAALTIVAGAAEGATVRVLLQRDAPARVRVRISALRVTGAVEERITTECEAPGPCELPLTPGIWVLAGGDPLFYVAARSVTVAGDSDAGATLTVSDTTAVTLSTPGTSGAGASLVFRSADAEDAVPCARVEDRWTCRVPRGTWDLQFRMRGYASHSFYDVHLGASPRAFGALKLTKGASLAGRVTMPVRDARARKVVVTATPSGVAAGGERSSGATRAHADAKGFFQFAGMAPGEYRVQARRGTMSSAAVAVTVIAGREAVLREPLAIAEPLTVTVSVADLSASGTRWRVELRRVEAEQREPLESRSAASGIVRFSASTGLHELAVLDERGSTWGRRTVDVGQDATDVAFVLNPRLVAGHVRVGESGVPASLTFQHGGTGCSIVASSGDDGAFAVLLPSAPDSDPWRVEIASPARHLQRTIADARVRTDAQGAGRLDLELPVTRLAGRVVDGEGVAVTRGFVNVVAAEGDDGLAQMDIADDGEFAVDALEPGRYSVRALMLDGRSSEVAYASVGEGETRVTLTVSAERMLRGLVTSDAGPVAGATVTAMPTDREVDFFAPRRTDGGGRFAFTLPEGSTECDLEVDAPGFALRIFHRRLESGSVVIPVHQFGGRLRVRLPPWSGGETLPHPWLIHDGAAVTAYTIDRQRTFLRGAATVAEAVVEPGAYAVCVGTAAELPAFRAGMLPADRCTSGMLAPFGELELDAREDRPGASGGPV